VAAAAVAAVVAAGGAAAAGADRMTGRSDHGPAARPAGPVDGATASAPAEEGVRASTLDGGLRVVTERMPGVRSVALGVWVGVGNRDEPAPIAGASHFLEHLLFKGTPTRAAREIAETVDATGGDLNAYTTKEYTAFYGRLPSWHTDLGLDLLFDVVARPAFRAAEVDSERNVILEELHLQLDDPDDLVHSVLYEALFPEHPLGWEVLGTIGSVAAVTPTDLEAFHARWYRPANLVVVAAGDVDHDQVAAAAAAAFPAGAGAGERPERAAPAQPPVAVTMVRRRTEQVHLALGWRALPHGDEDRFALSIANQVLGGGLSSRLFQAIREERGLAYSVYSGLSAYADSGVLSVYAGTAPERLAELCAVLGDELRRVADEGISERELAVAADGVEGSTILSLEDPGSRMSRLGTSETVLGRVLPIDDYLERVAAVTVDDVTRVLRRVLATGPSVAVVGPVRKGVAPVERLASALRG
jgi:predicted Zn-dependent peptidase